MSAELTAVLAVGAMMFGVVVVAGLILSALREVREELREVRGELRDVRKDIDDLRKELGELRERMARLEGMFEGFARSSEREPA